MFPLKHQQSSVSSSMMDKIISLVELLRCSIDEEMSQKLVLISQSPQKCQKMRQCIIAIEGELKNVNCSLPSASTVASLSLPRRLYHTNHPNGKMLSMALNKSHQLNHTHSHSHTHTHAPQHAHNSSHSNHQKYYHHQQQQQLENDDHDDPAPTDYSQKYKESPISEFEAPRAKPFVPVEDTFQVYQTEGTPLNFSISSSLSDLRDGMFSIEEVNPLKPLNEEDDQHSISSSDFNRPNRTNSLPFIVGAIEKSTFNSMKPIPPPIPPKPSNLCTRASLSGNTSAKSDVASLTDDVQSHLAETESEAHKLHSNVNEKLTVRDEVNQLNSSNEQSLLSSPVSSRSVGSVGKKSIGNSQLSVNSEKEANTENIKTLTVTPKSTPNNLSPTISGEQLSGKIATDFDLFNDDIDPTQESQTQEEEEDQSIKEEEEDSISISSSSDVQVQTNPGNHEKDYDSDYDKEVLYECIAFGMPKGKLKNGRNSNDVNGNQLKKKEEKDSKEEANAQKPHIVTQIKIHQTTNNSKKLQQQHVNRNVIPSHQSKLETEISNLKREGKWLTDLVMNKSGMTDSMSGIESVLPPSVMEDAMISSREWSDTSSGRKKTHTIGVKEIPLENVKAPSLMDQISGIANNVNVMTESCASVSSDIFDEEYNENEDENVTNAANNVHKLTREEPEEEEDEQLDKTEQTTLVASGVRNGCVDGLPLESPTVCTDIITEFEETLKRNAVIVNYSSEESDDPEAMDQIRKFNKRMSPVGSEGYLMDKNLSDLSGDAASDEDSHATYNVISISPRKARIMERPIERPIIARESSSSSTHTKILSYSPDLPRSPFSRPKVNQVKKCVIKDTKTSALRASRSRSVDHHEIDRIEQEHFNQHFNQTQAQHEPIQTTVLAAHSHTHLHHKQQQVLPSSFSNAKVKCSSAHSLSKVNSSKTNLPMRKEHFFKKTSSRPHASSSSSQLHHHHGQAHDGFDMSRSSSGSSIEITPTCTSFPKKSVQSRIASLWKKGIKSTADKMLSSNSNSNSNSQSSHPNANKAELSRSIVSRRSFGKSKLTHSTSMNVPKSMRTSIARSSSFDKLERL